jgi:hypothetical protein
MERLLCGIVRREWFRAETDEVVNAVTLVLIAASMVLIGSLVVWLLPLSPTPEAPKLATVWERVNSMDRIRGILGHVEAHVVLDALTLGLMAASVVLLGSLVVWSDRLDREERR